MNPDDEHEVPTKPQTPASRTFAVFVEACNEFIVKLEPHRTQLADGLRVQLLTLRARFEYWEVSPPDVVQRSTDIQALWHLREQLEAFFHGGR